MLFGVMLIRGLCSWIKRMANKTRLRIRKRNRFLVWLSILFWFVLLLFLAPTAVTLGTPFLHISIPLLRAEYQVFHHIQESLPATELPDTDQQ